LGRADEFTEFTIDDFSEIESVPTLPVGSWPGAAASQMGNPFEAYMQITQQWQKLWADAMAPWMKAGNSK
jgi:hypothetical protein